MFRKICQKDYKKKVYSNILQGNLSNYKSHQVQQQENQLMRV